MKQFSIILAALCTLSVLTACPQKRPGDDSPNMGKILFSTQRDGNQEIYIMNGDGSGSANLTKNPTNDYMPRWSMDRSKVVFVSERDGNPEIYIMDANGKNPRRLTQHDATDVDPDLSPDGKWVAFTSNRTSNQEVFIIKTDGTGLRNISSHAALDGVPRWSPDGKKLLFVSDRDGNFELYTMGIDGENPTNLTNNAANDFMGNWAIDGKSIVFVSERGQAKQDSPTNEIYQLDLASMNARRLTRGDYRKYGPVLSRNGKFILFNGGFSMENEDYQLVRIKRDGTEQKVLTTGTDNSDGDW